MEPPFSILLAGRGLRPAFLSLVLVLLSVPGHAQEQKYRLTATANRPAVQVDGNTQIELTLSGIKLSDLMKMPVDGLDSEQAISLKGNIGYSPGTPGIKEIGPFELEFQGESLRSGVVLVEAVPDWSSGEEGYQFQVFPRTVVKGEPIRITFRQQYSGEPLVDMTGKSLHTSVRLRRQPEGMQVIEAQGPPKSWTSAGSSGSQSEGKPFHLTTWSFDIPTSEAGKFSITRNDLPALPEHIVFEPVEVEVVETGAVVPPVPGNKNSRPAGPSGAGLTLTMQPRAIQLGDNVHLTVVLDGVKVADLWEKALPDAPGLSEWSREISFSSHMECTPETPGEKTYGPFVMEFQGERIVSNSQTIEVTPDWPRDAERYEFRIFPRKVVVGTPIRVTFRQQYSAKPYLEIPYNNPRRPNPNLWGSPGTQGWMENGRKFTRMVSIFDIPTTKAGKMVITRDNLPPMDASIIFEPTEIEVTENH